MWSRSSCGINLDRLAQPVCLAEKNIRDQAHSRASGGLGPGMY
jgi:hypothetical protein